MTTDDWELVTRYRAGDYDAGRQLLDHHWDRLIRMALPKAGGNWHDAQDAVGDALAALADYRGKDPIRSVGPWLRSVALRRVVDKVRSKEPRPSGESDESLLDPHEEVEQVDGRLAASHLLQALDTTERRVMAVALDGRTAGWSRLDQARMLNMELYGDYKRAWRQARQQMREALLLLHMLHPENAPCQKLLEACGVTPGEEGEGPQLTPEGRKAGMDHIGTCKACPAKREKVKDRRWVPGVVLAPSPELYDRVRNICDAQRLRNEPEPGNERAQRNAGPEAQGSSHIGLRRKTTRAGTRAARWDEPPVGPRSVQRRRPKRRLAKTIGAGVLAALLAITVIDKSGADIGLPELGTLPGVESFSGPSGQAGGGGSTDGGGTDDGSGNGGGTGGRNTDGGRTGDGSIDDGGTDTGGADDGSIDEGSAEDGNTDDGAADDGSADDGSADDGSIDDGPADDGGTDDGSADDGMDEGNDDGGDADEGVVSPPQDTTGPSVALSGISTGAVGQEVVGTGGSVMQTCGPEGTPTTYSVWVAASDPSGIYFVVLYIQHPTDGTYESSAGVADGDAIRFDVPAYRTGPKPQDTVQLRLSATAKDMSGNRTDADLGTLSLYECGEPG